MPGIQRVPWCLTLFLLLPGCWRSVPVGADAGEVGDEDDSHEYEELFPGPCVREERPEGREPSERCEFRYDRQERISVIECDEDPFRELDGIIDYTVTHEYGDADTPSRTLTEHRDDGTTIIETYDSDGNRVESTARYSDGLEVTETCRYESVDAHVVVRSCGGSLFDDDFSDQMILQYDEAGLLVVSDWDSGADGTVNTHTVYSYDDENRLVLEEKFFAYPDGEMNDLSDHRVRYSYDRAGNLLEEIQDSGTEALRNGPIQITAHYRFYYDCFVD